MLVIKDGMLVCSECQRPVEVQKDRPSSVNMETVSLYCECGHRTRMNATGYYAVEFVLEEPESPK